MDALEVNKSAGEALYMHRKRQQGRSVLEIQINIINAHCYAHLDN